MYTIIVHLLSAASLLSAATPVESRAADPVPAGDARGSTHFTEFARDEAMAIEDAYVKGAADQATFDRLAADDYEEFSCWSYPGNVGCWIGDWLVSCEKNANTNDEWDCGVAHHDDLD